LEWHPGGFNSNWKCIDVVKTFSRSNGEDQEPEPAQLEDSRLDSEDIKPLSGKMMGEGLSQSVVNFLKGSVSVALVDFPHGCFGSHVAVFDATVVELAPSDIARLIGRLLTTPPWMTMT